MKLEEAETTVLRSSLIDQIRRIDDEIYDLKTFLKIHKVDPKSSELLSVYEESKEVLKRVQGALLKSGTIEYVGELE